MLGEVLRPDRIFFVGIGGGVIVDDFFSIGKVLVDEGSERLKTARELFGDEFCFFDRLIPFLDFFCLPTDDEGELVDDPYLFDVFEERAAGDGAGFLVEGIDDCIEAEFKVFSSDLMLFEEVGGELEVRTEKTLLQRCPENVIAEEDPEFRDSVFAEALFHLQCHIGRHRLVFAEFYRRNSDAALSYPRRNFGPAAKGVKVVRLAYRCRLKGAPWFESGRKEFLWKGRQVERVVVEEIRQGWIYRGRCNCRRGGGLRQRHCRRVRLGFVAVEVEVVAEEGDFSLQIFHILFDKEGGPVEHTHEDEEACAGDETENV